MMNYRSRFVHLLGLDEELAIGLLGESKDGAHELAFREDAELLVSILREIYGQGIAIEDPSEFPNQTFENDDILARFNMTDKSEPLIYTASLIINQSRIEKEKAAGLISRLTSEGPRLAYTTNMIRKGEYWLDISKTRRIFGIRTNVSTGGQVLQDLGVQKAEGLVCDYGLNFGGQRYTTIHYDAAQSF